VNIFEVKTDQKRYLPLLLLGDEQEDMIDRYLGRGTMYALDDGGVKAVCVVTDEGGGALELKNLAVSPRCQRRGYGRRMVDFLAETYRGRYTRLLAGTGDSPLTVPFYEACGFRRSHVVPSFFTDHYDHPIFEGGIQLVDMIYLSKPL
jgi:hypothetical protein